MSAKTIIKRLLFPAIFVCCLCGAIGDTVAGSLPGSSSLSVEGRGAARTGEELERSRSWLEAIEHYEDALKKWPQSKELQYGLRRSKVHFGIERRYDDRSFESSLLPKSQREALILFDEVLGKIKSHYVDPVSSTSFVAHGTESLYLALANKKFLAKNLPNVDPHRIKQMRKILREQFWNKPVPHRIAADQTVVEVCNLAREVLGLRGAAVALEYVFGGCNALDDYSSYLTPDRLNDLYGNIEGEFVGLGIEMKAELGKGMLLVNVLPDSPAAQGGLLPGDHITSIDGTNSRQLTTEEAARLLRGSAGSRVRLELLGENERIREREFIRRPVQVKSIPVARILPGDEGVGYIRMTGFQKTSAAELDDALARLRQQGMRSLIWDLRGNPGGLLTAAVEVVDRFIAEGLLVSTRGRTDDQNFVYSAHRPGTWAMPVVLLVDGDSASASEIVAGAIHDHRRGLIVGRTTYGKWSVQSILPLHSSTGLRLTTAKFYSPRGHTLGKVGVRPDVTVEVPEEHTTLYRGTEKIDVETDPDLRKGLEALRGQLSRR